MNEISNRLARKLVATFYINIKDIIQNSQNKVIERKNKKISYNLLSFTVNPYQSPVTQHIAIRRLYREMVYNEEPAMVKAFSKAIDTLNESIEKILEDTRTLLLDAIKANKSILVGDMNGIPATIKIKTCIQCGEKMNMNWMCTPKCWRKHIK